MVYEYQCDKCSERIEKDFSMGKAPRSIKCGCGAKAKRVYSGLAISINGAIDRKSTFGEEMKKRNQKAAHRQQGRDAPVKLKALDYGNGDIREVKK